MQTIPDTLATRTTGNETWLVTGGSGFIGDCLCRRLAAEGKRVRVLDLLQPEFDVDFVYGDVRDPQAVAVALDGVTHVAHLAAAHDDHGIDDETYFGVNVDGTRMLCEQMSQRGIDRMCFTSSVAVYGNATDSSESNRDLKPTNAYGKSKLEAESIIEDWTKARAGRTAVIIRPVVVFGPRNYGNMFRLIRIIDRGWYWPVGAGNNVKSTAYVDNLVDAIVFLAYQHDDGFHVFNYADKPDLTSGQITELITNFLGRRRRPPIPLRLAPVIGKVGDLIDRMTKRNVPITSARILKLAKAQTEFDCYLVSQGLVQPRTSLEEGLRRMVEWYLADDFQPTSVSRNPPPTIVRYPSERSA